ncbi:MAG TPA: hypothetical protein VH208_02540 [Myxococcaceae bacterium]|nr:hypothetical protein [Myxococcaceae bacterium]
MSRARGGFLKDVVGVTTYVAGIVQMVINCPACGVERPLLEFPGTRCLVCSTPGPDDIALIATERPRVDLSGVKLRPLVLLAVGVLVVLIVAWLVARRFRSATR